VFRGLAVLALLALAFVPAAAGRTPIVGGPGASAEQAAAWARGNGATRTFVRLARIYWEEAPRRGIRPEVAYAQAAKETNFGRFTGVLDPSFRNVAGLKRRAGGGNYDPRAHKRFSSWRSGVSAQLDHLALYAGVQGYPKARTSDPRHFPFLRGRAPTVERLGGAWAPSPTYGREVVRFVREIVRSPGLRPRAVGWTPVLGRACSAFGREIVRIAREIARRTVGR
jgi:hypothetical protein